MRINRKVGWQIVSYGTGALAALATRRALTAAWQGVRRTPPPDDPANRQIPWPQALTWAIATSVGIGVARLVALRGAAAVWEATAHEPPPIT